MQIARVRACRAGYERNYPFEAHASEADTSAGSDGKRDAGQNWTGLRGFEGMAVGPNGTYLYAALEGPKIADSDQSRRWIYEFSVRRKAFTGRTWQYRAENAGYMVSDMSMLDPHRIVVMERDGGLGLAATFRSCTSSTSGDWTATASSTRRPFWT